MPTLYMQSLRRTGRTTRMLQSMYEYILNNKDINIALVGTTFSHAHTLLEIFKQTFPDAIIDATNPHVVIAINGHVIKCVSQENLQRNTLGITFAKQFIDHSVFEKSWRVG